MTPAAFSIERISEQQQPLPLREAFSSGSLILVVDDDPAVRRLICAFLKSRTMASVMGTSDPYAAPSVALNAGRPIDLLIADVELSVNKNGIDLARELVERNPAMKVLLISGSNVPQFQMPSPWRFLEKPFAMPDLVDQVNALGGSFCRVPSR